MGCDIHPIVEIKIGGAWTYYGEMGIGREYALFGRMAGVRDPTQKPIAAPRGVPADASALTKLIVSIYGSDGHTHSWLNADELRALDDWYAANLAPAPPFSGYQRSLFSGPHGRCLYFFGNYLCDWWRDPSTRPEGVEDVRLVFFFDS